MLTRVAVALGSNLGDRLGNLCLGVARLRLVLADLRISSVYETAPVDYEAQPPFLNACCVGWTRLTPHQLLSELQDGERAAGRRRRPRYGPRELDLDLLLYGDLTLDSDILIIPHPRLPERAFVLAPLAEIAADWTVPGSMDREAATVAELADVVNRAGIARTELAL